MASAFLLSSASFYAQATDYIPLNGEFDFLAVRNIKLFTTNILDKEQIKAWDSEGLHAGFETFSLQLFNCKGIPENITVPENTLLVCEIRDMNGNIVGNNDTDMSHVFDKLKFVETVLDGPGIGMNIYRGGKYKLTAMITPGLFSYETDVIFQDEPGIQIFNTSSKTDEPICPSLTITSGYPYVPEQFVGEKHLHWQLTSIKSPSEVIVEKDEVFELKSETPTLAAVAKFNLAVEGLEPGEYLYTITSDYEPANYTFKAIVNDVLKPEISLDKSIYKFGENKEAIVSVDMNYGYPYVGVSSSFDKPTITVNADLLGEKTSVSYSDETWADSDMHCMADVKIPLEKVTEETIKENGGKIPLVMSVLFNGTERFRTTISLPFEFDSSSIWEINADNLDKSKVRYFNILGVEVDESYKGLVISSDGHKIIR